MTQKLIALDLDGTLLRDDCTISPHTQEVLRRCLDAGHIIVPCTGRSYKNSRFVLRDFSAFPYYINANGATIVQGDTEQPLFITALPFETGYEIYKIAKEYQTFIEIYYGTTASDDAEGRKNIVLTPYNASYCAQLLETNTHFESFDDTLFKERLPITKYHIVCLSSEVSNVLKKRVAQIPDVYPISTTTFNVEVTNLGWSKRDSLEWLCRHLHFSPEQVIAIGDSENDLEIIKWAGMGIAMGNAFPEVQAAADFVTGTNEEDGVAEALERFVLS